jgi:small-conductance mechanosensitive channel
LGFSLALAVSVIVVPLRAQAPSDIPNLPDSSAVIAYLNQAIEWNRHLLAEEQLATDPADLLFLNNARQMANQVLQLSFDFAKADAEMLAKQQSTTPTSVEKQPSQAQSLMQLANSAAAEVRQRQDELQSLKQQLAKAVGHKRRQLASQLRAMQSELELEQARSANLREIAQFVAAQGTAQRDLQGQIEELRRSIPELESGTSNTSQTAAQTAGSSSSSMAPRQQPSGIVALIEELFGLRRKMTTLDDGISSTDALSQSANKLHKPLVSALTTEVQQGDQAIRQSGTTPADEKQRLDALTAQFKQISVLVLPLSKQAILLDAYKSNLRNWRSTINSHYYLDLKRLTVRLAILVFVVALVIALAEIWRRAIFRYVHDVRRRYQLLLLRRIAIWIVIAVTIAFALASQIGSIATFIGLITAGVAVSLQTVIMAIVGYFFLIGRYGVRVGDRVQIGGVTGDVIDIGLVRLHLMEIGSADTSCQPTGRVVVFSNAIVLQPGASFYKQIPGTNFVWHQVSLTLAPDADYRLAEKRMMEAVESVYANYHDHIESQHRRMQKTLNFDVALPKPQSRLRFTGGGLEILISFPTDLENAYQIDDQVTRQLLTAIEQSPKLKLVGSGTPNIHPLNEGPQTKAS